MIELSTNGEWGLFGPYQLETTEAFSCVMAALEQGTVGTYRWQVPSLNPPFGGYGQFGVLHVLSGRIGLETVDHGGDLGTLRFTLGPASLRPPSYFQRCASATGDAAFACISDWSDGCSDR